MKIETLNTTTTRKLSYIYAGSELVCIASKTNLETSPTLHYVYTDYLGSVRCITNAAGVVEEKLSYNAWGFRRDAITGTVLSYDQLASSVATRLTARGYTGHEHLTAFGLINMNGRVYDPVLGSFLSPDNTVQGAGTQGFNRYSYCSNNPLKYTDPSGWFEVPAEINPDLVHGYGEYYWAGYNGGGHVSSANYACGGGGYTTNMTGTYFDASGEVVPWYEVKNYLFSTNTVTTIFDNKRDGNCDKIYRDSQGGVTMQWYNGKGDIYSASINFIKGLDEFTLTLSCLSANIQSTKLTPSNSYLNIPEIIMTDDNYVSITFNSFTSDGKSSNVPVDRNVTFVLMNALQVANQTAKIRSLNIYATTNGHADKPNSLHRVNRGVDINMINDIRIAIQGASPEVIALQVALGKNKYVIENKGPYIGTDENHLNHIHFAVTPYYR